MSDAVGIATEGPASEAVLRALCRRLGVEHRVRSTEGKPKLFQEFPRIFRTMQGAASRFVVAPDLQPATDCVAERVRWNAAIQKEFPQARLSLVILETESRFLADPAALHASLGIRVEAADPERTHGEKPADVIERALKAARGYGRGIHYHKRADGPKIVEKLDLDRVAGRCPSFRRFVHLVRGSGSAKR